MSRSTIWLSCGVVRAEMNELHRRGAIVGELRFLDSMLHMDPQHLESLLKTAIAAVRGHEADRGRRLVVVYGDCSPGMLDLVRTVRAGRVDAINCAQLLVGRTHYRELMEEQAFVLLPEWATRWHDIMHSELGLSREVARGLMQEHRRVLVYLDTGLVPIPVQAMVECSDYTGLPWRTETIALDSLLTSLRAAEQRAETADRGTGAP